MEKWTRKNIAQKNGNFFVDTIKGNDYKIKFERIKGENNKLVDFLSHEV